VILVGVTGGIGSGKSTVAQVFGTLGAYVLDADQVAREITETDAALMLRIRELFGDEVFDDSGRLDRRKLAHRVFPQPEAIQKLNELLHPPVIQHIEKRISEIFHKDPEAVVVIDAPLIFETGYDQKLDCVVVVDAPIELCIRRVMERSDLSREEVLARMKAQMSPKEKRCRADFVIHNSGNLAALQRRATEVYQQILRRFGESPPTHAQTRSTESRNKPDR